MIFPTSVSLLKTCSCMVIHRLEKPQHRHASPSLSRKELWLKAGPGRVGRSAEGTIYTAHSSTFFLLFLHTYLLVMGELHKSFHLQEHPALHNAAMGLYIAPSGVIMGSFLMFLELFHQLPWLHR